MAQERTIPEDMGRREFKQEGNVFTVGDETRYATIEWRDHYDRGDFGGHQYQGSGLEVQIWGNSEGEERQIWGGYGFHRYQQGKPMWEESPDERLQTLTGLKSVLADHDLSLPDSLAGKLFEKQVEWEIEMDGVEVVTEEIEYSNHPSRFGVVRSLLDAEAKAAAEYGVEIPNLTPEQYPDDNAFDFNGPTLEEMRQAGYFDNDYLFEVSEQLKTEFGAGLAEHEGIASYEEITSEKNWGARFEDAMKKIAGIESSDPSGLRTWKDLAEAASEIARGAVPPDAQRIAPDLTKEDGNRLHGLQAIAIMESWEGNLSWKEKTEAAREIARATLEIQASREASQEKIPQSEIGIGYLDS